jgi:hypothetical protein
MPLEVHIANCRIYLKCWDRDTQSCLCGRLTQMRLVPWMAWVALVLSLATAMACYLAVGVTLGLYFGGLIFTSILVPTCCMTEQRVVSRLLVAAAVADGTAIVWLVCVFISSTTLVQWLMCYAVLLAWAMALVGLCAIISPTRPNRASIPGSAIAMFLSLAWLTCPVWLQTRAAVVVPVHPLFALNRVLLDLGLWTIRPIAYRYLVSLGQDVPYELPGTIIPMLVLHLLVGVAGLLAASRVAGRR